ncbi:hypothetical protein CHLRE_05g238364v5 [Chlamydomonas reinhardtii]|uniref:Uncharacterized protein n=1 Tax=Chlamydomonas reinhardtii TaxID=3055 RepID=A0A2K3DT10_CHLRE|nr:uncharacterized protein CHLRE_05g238364v5 [Chlamydomonas reinhardtii]PNW83663.1 hypothetical protein CHLRE_05g238364v5 [Chlamydomonas reinhardtii]
MAPKEPEGPGRPSAAPPPCPRCELVKSQCTKTVINYQKSHRKKVEALRSELKASRQREQRLQRQLRFYKATFRLVPGAAIVAAVGWFIARRLRRSPVAAASEEADAGAAAKAGDGGAGASAEAASSAQPEEAAVATA